jgi:hypothetical protein
MVRLLLLVTTVGLIWCYSSEVDEAPNDQCASWHDEYVKTSWHEEYVRDACARCPECCATDDPCNLCPGKECKCFRDPYEVWRPLDWLPKDDE